MAPTSLRRGSERLQSRPQLQGKVISRGVVMEHACMMTLSKSRFLIISRFLRFFHFIFFFVFVFFGYTHAWMDGLMEWCVVFLHTLHLTPHTLPYTLQYIHEGWTRTSHMYLRETKQSEQRLFLFLCVSHVKDRQTDRISHISSPSWGPLSLLVYL